jgi:hypothetical protein
MNSTAESARPFAAFFFFSFARFCDQHGETHGFDELLNERCAVTFDMRGDFAAQGVASVTRESRVTAHTQVAVRSFRSSKRNGQARVRIFDTADIDGRRETHAD